MSDASRPASSSLITHHSSLAVHAALLTVAILFSANYIISKLAMRAFAPLTFAYLRVAGSAIVLNAVIRERDPAPLTRRDRWELVAFAALAIVINQTFFLAGLSLTDAHVAAILITTLPVFVLAASIVLKRERGSAAKIGGIALAAAGALLVVGGEGFAGATKSLVGDLLIVGNSLAYGLYIVLSKPMMARHSARRVIARMFAIAAALMLPVAAWSLLHQPWHVPARAWIGLALVIAGPTVAAYLLNAWALRHADSSLVAVYTYVQPVLTAFLAAVFLGETIRAVVVIAAVMIFAGVLISGRPAPPAATEEAVPGNPD
jgi:drug/metabolite transporter (DMT)-like permease